MGTIQARLLVVGLFPLLPATVAAGDRPTDMSRRVAMTIGTLFLWDGVAAAEARSSIRIPWKGEPDAANVHGAESAEMIQAGDPGIIDRVDAEDRFGLTGLARGFEKTDSPLQSRLTLL